ncbi:MAG: hypothetical protein O2780_21070 [Proteobacteria bacterium]|jgi:protein Xni|nr:hypothetical protein [Pseudomonadota bacterium]
MKVLLVDGFNMMRRIYEARSDPDLAAVTTAAARSLARALDEHDPSHAVVVLERHDRTWRHLLYSEYKAGRLPAPALLTDNLAAFEAAFLGVGVASYSLASYEADDVIATLAVGVAAAGGQAVILSSDRLYLQMLCDQIEIVNHFDGTRASPESVLARYGVRVEQLTDFWALAGDHSNNIKGVPGIGPKTAARLLSRFDDLAGIIANDDAACGRVREHEDLVRRCLQLVTLKTDVDLGVNLRTFRLGHRPPFSGGDHIG